MALNIVNDSVRVGTYAEVMARAGAFRGQRSIVTDYGMAGGLIYVWSGSAWVLMPGEQPLARQHTQVAAGTTETTLFTANLPPLGANDGFRLAVFWGMTGVAGNKTLAVKIGATSIYSQTFNTAADVRDIFFFNRNATNVQIGGHRNANVYGSSGAALSDSTIQTNVATTVTIAGTRLSGDTMTLERAVLCAIGGS
jgi:hypothetical protein